MSDIMPTLEEVKAAYQEAFKLEIKLRRELESVRWRWTKQRKRRAVLDALLSDLEHSGQQRIAGD